jgi:LacI family transcriptional regulator
MKKSKPATLQMIANELGVTVTTVSCILNNKGGTYAEATRQKVLETAAKFKYRPNVLAHGMRGGKTHSAGVMIRNQGYFLNRVINGIHDTLLNHQTLMLLAWNDRNHHQLDWNPEVEKLIVHHLLDRRVDGFILCSSSENFDQCYVSEILERHVPLVLVDRELKSLNADFIGTDNVVGGEVAARHLLDLGHRQLLCCSLQQCSNAVARQEAFDRMVGDCAGATTQTLDFFGEDFHEVLAGILKNPETRPTGIFCINDYVALRVLEIAKELELSAPRDFSIIGFGDQRFAEPAAMNLSTFDQYPYAIGEAAAHAYLRHVRAKVAHTTPRILRIDPKFLDKGSTGPVPKKAARKQKKLCAQDAITAP